MSHTKGPWIITPDGEANFVGIATEKGWLMRIQQNGELSVEEQIANARIIAAARDMLDTLISIRQTLESMKKDSTVDGMLFITDLAINKAKEGQPS